MVRLKSTTASCKSFRQRCKANVPAYSAAPNAIIYGLVPGQPGYSAGVHPTSANWKAYVTAMSVASNVVTLFVSTQHGNIPLVGDLVTVAGTPIAAANVTNVALASVSITASTGAGTITYAATTANLAKFNCGGQAIAPPADVPDATTANTSFAALGLPNNVPQFKNGHLVTASVTHPTAWNSATVYNVQVAINNVDAEYVSLGANLTADGTTLFTVPETYNFIRYRELASGTNTTATVIAKFLI